MEEFRTKAEVDQWYQITMDGLRRVLRIYEQQSLDPCGTPNDYLSTIILTARNLTGLRDNLYRILRIPEDPPSISLIGR